MIDALEAESLYLRLRRDYGIVITTDFTDFHGFRGEG